MDIDFKNQYNTENVKPEVDDLYPSVKDSIEVIAKKEGYMSYDVYKKRISAVGGNYLGALYEVNIKGKTVKGNKETNIFLKQAIPDSENMKLFSIAELYNREAFVYKELANVFADLENKANIPIKDRFKLVKNYDESNTDAIILENMTKQGFTTNSRMDVMKLDYAEFCIEELAKFHSLAFVIEKKMPKYFDSHIKSLKHSLVIDENYKEFMAKIYKTATKKLDDNLKSRVDKWWETAVEKYSKYLNGVMTDVKCLCHGDFKMNNLLHKEINGEITDVIIIDYQLMHYGSPVLDFIYFICMGTDREFRRKYLDHLKDHYHVSLKTYLQYFNLLVDDVYPKKQFEKDFEYCLDFAIVNSFYVLPFLLSADDNLDITDKKTINEGFTLDERYYDRLHGVLDDYFKYGL